MRTGIVMMLVCISFFGPFTGIARPQDEKEKRRIAGLIERIKKCTSKMDRICAINELGLRRGRAAAAVDLLISLAESEDLETARCCIDALGDIGQAKAIPHLRKHLSDKHPRLRRSAAFALAKLHDEEAVPGLVEALKSQNWRERSNAAVFLGSYGVVDSSALFPLIGCLGDPERYVKMNAAGSLGSYSDREKVLPLIRVLVEGDLDISERAANSLNGFFCCNAAVIAFEKFWSRGRNHCENIWGAFGIVKGFRHEKAFNDLVEWTRDGDSNDRAQAVTAIKLLHSFEDDVRLAVLKRAAADESEEVRFRSINGLGLIGDEEAIDALINALGDVSKRIVVSAARELQIRQVVRSVRPMIEALEREDVRSEVHFMLCLMTGNEFDSTGPGFRHLHRQWLEWYEKEGHKEFPQGK